MICLTTLLIHSYLYLPSYYKLKNITIKDSKIIYNNTNVIYNLNNIPENNNDYSLYYIFLDSVCNNSYNNYDYPEPFSDDLHECNNFRLIVNINNLEFQRIINNNDQIPSEAIFFKLLENNNYFSRPLYNSINLNMNHSELSNITFDLLESEINKNNYFANNIFKNHNLFFYSLINKYSCRLKNRSSYMKIKGGVIPKNIDYLQLFEDKIGEKNILLITDNDNYWKELFSMKEYQYSIIDNNNDINKNSGYLTYFCKYDDIISNSYNNIYDIYWDRVIIDINIDIEDKFGKVLKNIKSHYKWFLMLNGNNSTIRNVIFEHLIDFKNIKVPFLKLISKKITSKSTVDYHRVKNIVLDFSNYEKKRYNENHERKDDFNKIYLKKLCCYPDIFFDFNKLFFKSNTISQYKQITRNFYKLDGKSKYKKISFINNQTKFFKKGNYNCPICLDDVSQKNFGITICGHIFCYSCINKSINFTSKCPECRFPIYNNFYKIDTFNSNLKLLDYNTNNLINLVGTKITFIIYLLNLNKTEKIIICSEFYSFLEKIKLTLNNFEISNIMLDNSQYSDSKIKDVKVFLCHNKILLKKKYTLLNIDKIIFGDPISHNRLIRIISNISLSNTTLIYKLIINNTIETNM